MLPIYIYILYVCVLVCMYVRLNCSVCAHYQAPEVFAESTAIMDQYGTRHDVCMDLSRRILVSLIYLLFCVYLHILYQILIYDIIPLPT